MNHPPKQLFRIAVLVALPAGTLDVFLPLYVLALHHSQAIAGFLVAVGAAATLVVRPIAGALIDRGHPWAVVRYGTLAIGLGLLCWALAPSVVWLFAGRLIYAAGRTSQTLAFNVLLAQQSTERGHNYGQLTAATALGSGIGAGIAGLPFILFDREIQATLQPILTTVWSAFQFPAAWERVAILHLVYALYALGAALGLLWLWRMPRTTITHHTEPLLKVWRRLAEHPQLRRIVGAEVSLQVAYSLAIPHIYALITTQFGSDLGGVVLAYAIPGIIYVLGPTPLGTLADRIGYARAARWGLFGSASVYGLLPLMPSLVWAAAIWSGEAIAFGLFVPALLALIASQSRSGERGATFSLIGILTNLGALIAAPLGGILFDHVAPWMPFSLAAGALLMAGIIVRGVDTPKRQEHYG